MTTTTAIRQLEQALARSGIDWKRTDSARWISLLDDLLDCHPQPTREQVEGVFYSHGWNVRTCHKTIDAIRALWKPQKGIEEIPAGKMQVVDLPSHEICMTCSHCMDCAACGTKRP